MINPLGHDVETVWTALKQGKSAVGLTTIFDASQFPTKISAEVRNWDIGDIGEDPHQWRFRARHTRFAAGAAKQAVGASGILDSGSLDPSRFGVYLGCGEGNQDFASFTQMVTRGLTDEGLDITRFIKAGLEILNPMAELEQEPNMPAGYMASMFNAQGPNVNCLTACAASATEMIRQGDVDVMLAGGTHSMIHPFGVTGFNLLTALSTRNDEPERASRPFDRMRDGFVLGEGAAMVVLEELERAQKRGAQIFGEILGYGSTADAYRITDIHPEGRGAIACMNMALRDAQLNAEDVNYVNAHGTSTTVNDKVETLACKSVFGEHALSVPVSSTKSMMGHLIAAAGVTELIVCLMAIRDNVLPPTINYEFPDPQCDLDYVPNVAREARCDVALNNSFGFGGQNITLIVGRFRG
jgi:3-oxoacyl-[acyl-carrier-protein] synthase II